MSGTKPAILIASGDWAPESWAATLRGREPDRPIYCWPDLPPDVAGDIRYLLAWKPPAEVFAAVPNVEAVFSLGAGVDHVMGADIPVDIPVFRVVSGDLTGRMTEWIVLQVLLHHRRQHAYDRAQAAHRWQQLAQATAAEVRVGVMGLGVLGRDAAAMLARLGFQVAGWSRAPREVEGIACFHGEEGLDRFLARTDILVCLLPLTPETRGILARPLFAKLARDGATDGPVLINAGRGGLQVEADIVAAIGDGTLAGASLDVFEPEPLDAASPLWDLPGVVITPHVAAPSEAAVLAVEIHKQILAFEAGHEMRGRVDRHAGY